MWARGLFIYLAESLLSIRHNSKCFTNFDLVKSLSQPYEVGTVLVLMLQMVKLRHKGLHIAPDSTRAWERQSWDSDPADLPSGSRSEPQVLLAPTLGRSRVRV